MRKTVFLFMVLVIVIFLASVALKSRTPLDPVVSGGVTDNTDPTAPKTIKSKKITSFSTYFYSYDDYDDKKEGNYQFSIEKDESGQLMLKASGVYKLETPVTEAVLDGVQKIIDDYSLVKMNGGGKVTAGLPPEYQPWRLNVLYESGESLSFYENGMPDADWTMAFKRYFESVFAEAGFEEVLAPKEALAIESFSFYFNENDLWHRYGLIHMGEEQNLYFYHTAYRTPDRECEAKEYALIEDSLYEGLQTVIEEYGMDVLHAPGSVTFSKEISDGDNLEVYVDYVSGRQIYAEHSADTLPKDWPAMRTALIEYFGAYMTGHAIPEKDMEVE